MFYKRKNKSDHHPVKEYVSQRWSCFVYVCLQIYSGHVLRTSMGFGDKLIWIQILIRPLLEGI